MSFLVFINKIIMLSFGVVTWLGMRQIALWSIKENCVTFS